MLRGFKEKGDYQTYAGTAARFTQRIINSLSMMNPHYVLQSWDIGSAFAQRLSFAELARSTGEQIRSPVCGLKDAPRAWELRLRQLLTEGGLRPSMTDPRLYMLDIQDLPEHEKSSVSQVLKAGPPSGLVLACTTHVDDIKITGLPKYVSALAQRLERSVGKLTIETTQFTHTGVTHEVRTDGLYTHQSHYVLQEQTTESPLSPADRLTYLSLLGALSRLVQTRPDLAVHTNQVGLWYPRLKGAVRLVLFSDAAFRTQPEDSSGLAVKGSALVLIPETVNPQEGLQTQCHLLDFLSTQQRRVVRSTFSAELNGLLDATERGYGIQMTLSELLMKREKVEGRGQSTQAKTLQALWESGSLKPELWACIDAKSVYDALMAPDFHIPSEESLCLHLLALRNDISVRKLRLLLWIDARSMLADALTKGKVDKAQLTMAANAGVLQIPADHVIIKTIERACET
eukprot:4503531-Amphidinium_carterae.2